MIGVDASPSTTLSRLIAHHLGHTRGFANLAVEEMLALVVLATFLPETK
jgi:hypothetical protein